MEERHDVRLQEAFAEDTFESIAAAASADALSVFVVACAGKDAHRLITSPFFITN